MSHVLVRFPDDEMLEGEAPDLDLDRDNFELLVAGDGRAVIPRYKRLPQIPMRFQAAPVAR